MVSLTGFLPRQMMRPLWSAGSAAPDRLGRAIEPPFSYKKGGSRLLRQHSQNVPAQLGPAQRFALSLGHCAAYGVTFAPPASTPCGARGGGEEIVLFGAVQ